MEFDLGTGGYGHAESLAKVVQEPLSEYWYEFFLERKRFFGKGPRDITTAKEGEECVRYANQMEAERKTRSS